MQPLDEILDIGSRLMDHGEYSEAIEYFSRAIQLYPSDPQGYDSRGIALFRLLKVDEAVIEIKKAIACDPTFHLAYFHLGEISMGEKNFENARKYCEQALSIQPANELYLCTSAFIKLQLKDYTHCIELCSKVLDLNPANTFALEYRAHAYMNQKDYKRAVDDLEILYANTIPDSSILNGLGYSYSKIGETKLSKKFLLAAINIDPGYSYPYNNLGYVYMLEGKLSKAHALIDKSIELDPTNSYAYKNKALAYLKQNDTTNAIAALEKAKALRFDLYYGDEVNNMLNKLIGDTNH